jgi:hypothetical protein
MGFGYPVASLDFKVTAQPGPLRALIAGHCASRFPPYQAFVLQIFARERAAKPD